jgi:DNA topoisomerase-1
MSDDSEEEFTFGDEHASRPSTVGSSTVKKEDHDDDDDDDVPLRKLKKAKKVAIKKEDHDDDDMDADYEAEDVPKKKPRKKISKASVSKEGTNQKKKKKKPSLSAPDSPPRKKVKREAVTSPTVTKKAPRELKKLDKAERLQYAMQSFLWWNAQEPPPGCQWRTMEHAGVSFTEPYVPHGIPIYYNGTPVKLTPVQEEAATFFAAMDPEGMHLG